MTAVEVGQKLPVVSITPSALQLFRYSAVTWNMHRIHYDRDWAAHEGHAGLLVHSHLHAANAIKALTDGMGADWQLQVFDYRVLRPATEGTCLRVIAEITKVEEDGQQVELNVTELNPAGEACLEGRAAMVLRKEVIR